MLQRASFVGLVLVSLCGCAARPFASPLTASFETPAPSAQDKAAEPAAEESHGVGHALLLWIPNRVFDLFDIVRLRLRLGPGLSLGARVTEAVDFNFGAYASVWAGIHGPRGRPAIPWPLGVENLSGIELSIIDFTSEEGAHGPHYGPAEIGISAHLLLIGADIGVEPWDALDFLAGILLLDPNGDDY